MPIGAVAVPCTYIYGHTSVAYVDELRDIIALTTEFSKDISTKLLYKK
jgi:putative aminopeptidase FrvX